MFSHQSFGIAAVGLTGQCSIEAGRGSACGIAEEFFVTGIQGLLPGLSELLRHSIFLWYAHSWHGEPGHANAH